MRRMARLPKRSEAAAAAMQVGRQRTLGDGEGGVVPVNTAYVKGETLEQQVARIEAGRKPKLVCSVCAEPQFEAPDGAGITCKNGHGGADGISVLNASTAGRSLHPDKLETRVSEPTPDEEFLAAIDEFSDEVVSPQASSTPASISKADVALEMRKGVDGPVPAAVQRQAEEVKSKGVPRIPKEEGRRFAYTRVPAEQGGHINNCALANADEEKNCQICNGECPDRAKFQAEGAQRRKAQPIIPDLSRKTHQAGVELPGAWKDPPDPEPPLFDRATGRKDRLAPQFERLVTSVFDVSDIDQEFEDLKRQMVLGEQRSDYATVLRALDEAEDNARRAHRLFVNAQLEEKRFRLEREIVEAAMHKGAVASMKESGDKVTVEATQARMVELYAEEWREGEERKARVKGTVSHCEQLAFFFSSRCRSLQVILQSLRK
jgi:hypothetical protein